MAGTKFRLAAFGEDHDFYLPLIGLHNVYNAVAAIATGVVAGFSLAACGEHLKNFSGVPGRLENVTVKNGPYVFVDYAHTPGSLKSVLASLEEIRKKNYKASKIITVFGCGGERDQGKRPMMLNAAKSLSDIVIVTSDNPRSEDPESIIDDICKGFQGGGVYREVDRKQAISLALKTANLEDIVLIAGKGHEEYQIVGSKKKPFSDKQIAKEFLSEL